jgi:hypothetical protein
LIGKIYILWSLTKKFSGIMIYLTTVASCDIMTQ